VCRNLSANSHKHTTPQLAYFESGFLQFILFILSRSCLSIAPHIDGIPAFYRHNYARLYTSLSIFFDYKVFCGIIYVWIENLFLITISIQKFPNTILP